MAKSNTTTLNDLIGSIVNALVAEYAYSVEVMSKLCTFRMIEDGYGSVTMPRWATIAVGALTQATAPTAAALSTDGVTLTPTERGVLVELSKSVLRADPFTDLEPYAQTLARALGEDSDSLILAKMQHATNGFSGVVNNGAGASDMTLAHFRTAIATLLAANAPRPYSCVMHPDSWAKIMDDLDDAGSFSIPGKDVVEGHGEGKPVRDDMFVAAPYGVPIYLSTQVDATRDTNETYSNVMFSKEAWGIARKYDIRVDIAENVPARAYDLMAWYSQDQAELVDGYGVVIEDQVNS